MSAMRVCVSSAQYSFWRTKIFFFLSLGQGVYIFEESPKTIQDVIGDVFCPGEFCFNREKCKSIGGYVSTPKSIYGCEHCGAWLFVHRVPFKLQKHVKTTKTDKTRFSLLKKMLPDNQLFKNVPLQSTKNGNKEFCVDNKVRETIGDVFCPTCPKCVYISTNKTTSFYDWENPAPTSWIFLLGTKNRQLCCLVVSLFTRVATTKSHLHFWRNFSANHNQAHPNLNQKRLKRVQIWNKRIRFLLTDDLSNISIFQINLFNFNLQSTIQT